MSHPITAPVRLDTPLGVPLIAAFDAGRLTSDGGLPWLAEADQALGLCDTLARCLPEWRRGSVRHSLATLLRQRIYQITCGYADQNAAATLRHDPLLKLVCGRRPTTGAALASQPTFSRLENAVDRHAVEALATALVDLYIRERERAGPPQRIVLDFDGTDDPAHGEQEGVGYHGYYRPHLYHPLLVFDGDTGHRITAVLRPGRCHGSRLAVLVLRRLVRRFRRAWPDLAIEFRADSGFARPRLYAWWEAHAVRYTIGLIPTPPLQARVRPLRTVAQACSIAHGGAKVRLVAATDYPAQSGPHTRRVVRKAEIFDKGPNPRCVVTTRRGEPAAIYDWYVRRGEPENWLKDLKNPLQADRLSDHRFGANAFRLLLHAAAYWLLDTLRRWLAGTPAAQFQFDTLRLHLLKIGGRVREWSHRIRLSLASHHPGQPLWEYLSARPLRR